MTSLITLEVYFSVIKSVALVTFAGINVINVSAGEKGQRAC